jgi:hypothetical protein
MVAASGSPKTVVASWNDTPWLRRFCSAFAGCHVNFIYVVEGLCGEV